jgi:serine protease
MGSAATALLACAVALGAGCGRRVVPLAEVSDEDAVPGLIDVGLEGYTEEHHRLGAQLGEVVEDVRLEDDPLDDVDDPEELLVVRVDPDREAEALAALRARSDVHFAEPVVRVSALWQPDDPEFAKQWHLRTAGAPSAWNAARGAGVTVAIIDTGIAPVEDLDPARIVPGHNFLSGSDDARDDHGHGTHVAGTVAQTTDNGIGVAGMAPRARLMPLKVLGADGSGTSVAIADAIRWAADHGARVLNLSLGGGARSAAMANAVAYARRKGAVVVCAAGNTGARGVSYPAAYEGAIAVSSVGPKGKLAPYSSWGPQIRIAAPGGDKSQGEEGGVLQQTIDLADPGGKGVYRWFQGTSMAAPHVAGAAALIESLGVTNPGAVERLLESGASGAGPAEKYGAGIVDAGAAVRIATVWWAAWRFLLATAGALFALGHARRLGQLRARERAPAGLWLGVVAGAAAYTALAPLGIARIPGASLAALPLPAIATRLAPGGLVAYAAWSALVPFAIALVARGARPLRGFAAGLAFGWAGLLLHAALWRTVSLPVLPGFAVVLWLLVSSSICWWAGRGLLAREALR